MITMNILSIDPGRSKFGAAVVTSGGRVLYRRIEKVRDSASSAPPDAKEFLRLIIEKLSMVVNEVLSEFTIDLITLGDKTSSKQYLNALGAIIKKDIRLNGLSVTAVDESHTTQAARSLYHRNNPPFLLFRWLPYSLLPVFCDVDDFAAVAIALKYLKNNNISDNDNNVNNIFEADNTKGAR